MGKIVVIGATGTIGRAVVSSLSARHDVVEVGSTRGAYRVDATNIESVRKLFETIGKVDGVVTTTGRVHFGPLTETTPEQFDLGLRDKLMGQINVVLAAQPWLNDGGSFTLTSGISAHEPVREGSNASCVNLALQGFVMSAALELPRSIRINLVSPTILEESVPVFGDYFVGFEPVSSQRVGLAYLRCVEGPDTGRVFRVGY
ncbi:Short-chain dehydrogenase/reductase SDR [Caballeronia hypogeia]|uniref:Short-chain dehydrogenase/reductase SDR n=1 Tax=Caballeronia hypogeia TaxID=1777140 RepID=A0A158CZ61_9BURK|nr:short chain dehydrogenase [Caballeronia hypogeia]SAK87623.1 Short-chain dehydrogenase/reductase SDR [Caballeronia hypogeia]